MADNPETCSAADRRLSRRRVIAGALTGGMAAMLPVTGGTAAAATGESRVDATQFFSDSALNFQALFALGAMAYNAALAGGGAGGL
jgi:hypothetical protein